MSLTNEKCVFDRKESMELSTSEVESVGSKEFDHRGFNIDSFCNTETTSTAEEYHILFLNFRCITVAEDDQKFSK